MGAGDGEVEHVAQVFFGLPACLVLPLAGPHLVQLGIEEGGLVFGEVFLVAAQDCPGCPRALAGRSLLKRGPHPDPQAPVAQAKALEHGLCALSTVPRVVHHGRPLPPVVPRGKQRPVQKGKDLPECWTPDGDSLQCEGTRYAEAVRPVHFGSEEVSVTHRSSDAATYSHALSFRVLRGDADLRNSSRIRSDEQRAMESGRC